jgi:hypothetical protein
MVRWPGDFCWLGRGGNRFEEMMVSGIQVVEIFTMGGKSDKKPHRFGRCI